MSLESLVPLREFCRKRLWPRLPQWYHWINAGHPIALASIKKIGNRYLVDTEALDKYVMEATLNETKPIKNNSRARK